MSLLLKALKQAEASSSSRAGSDMPHAEGSETPDLELEPVSASGSAQAPEWVEPPGLLFGKGSVSSGPSRRASAFRWPRLSIVPATALIAALVALGYGIYLYFALQPPAAISIGSEAVAPPAAAPTPPAPAPAAKAETALAPAAPSQPMPEPAREAPAATSARVAPSAKPVRPAPRATASERIASAPASAPPTFQPDAQTALLGQAYAAYQRGQVAEAQRLYTQAAAQGRSIDALLGLAAIASVQHRDADAQRLYREVLDLDPRNAAAQAALLDLLGNTDSLAAESRLKTLIDRDPSPHLYQTLGNLYADQKRWSDAQAAYFEAYRGAPDNGDYAFNLAVSLDQLRQFPAARTYYEKALASAGAHRFDRAEAAARLQQLKSAR